MSSNIENPKKGTWHEWYLDTYGDENPADNIDPTIPLRYGFGRIQAGICDALERIAKAMETKPQPQTLPADSP